MRSSRETYHAKRDFYYSPSQAATNQRTTGNEAVGYFEGKPFTDYVMSGQPQPEQDSRLLGSGYLEDCDFTPKQ